MRVSTCLSFVMGLVFLAGRSFADDFGDSNHPKNLDSNYEYRLDVLPPAGDIEAEKRHLGWSDTYWPHALGGIGSRVTDQNETGELSSLDQLSPAEKLDLALGYRDGRFTQAVKKHTDKFNALWRGLCNGWARASLEIPEPQPFVVETTQGPMKIRSSDVKGLMAWYYSFIDDGDTKFLGRRCYMPGGLGFLQGGCRDVNPGAMHVLIANEIGVRKHGVIGDRDPGKEIWNQPFIKYQSLIRWDQQKIEKNRIRVPVGTRLVYANETAVAVETPVLGTNQQDYQTLDLEYILEIDAGSKMIVGGEWKSEIHPDFFWAQEFSLPRNFKPTKEDPVGRWSVLKDWIARSAPQ